MTDKLTNLEVKELLKRSYDDIAKGVEPTEYIDYMTKQGKTLVEIQETIEDNRKWIMNTVASIKEMK